MNRLAQQTIPLVAEHAVVINASPMHVWEALTNIDQMQQWMADAENPITIHTNWIVGHSFEIRGFHHEPFENKGMVLEFDPPRILRYTHLSSLSQLPDEPENHSIFEFRLESLDDQTRLTLTMRQFPTDSIFRHLDFYWRVTLGILKHFVENQSHDPV